MEKHSDNMLGAIMHPDSDRSLAFCLSRSPSLSLFLSLILVAIILIVLSSDDKGSYRFSR